MALRVAVVATASLTCLLTRAAAVAKTSSWDLGEWLAEEGKQDTEAYQQAECWCKELADLVASRISTAGGEMEQLGHAKEVQHYENEQLRMEVQEHQQEASGHSQSLGEAQSISERSDTKSQEEVQDLQDALHGIRKAIDTMPEGSDGRLHDTLRSLEKKFSDHLEESSQSMEVRQKQAQDLQKAKQAMMRLANQGAATKQRRLAKGLVSVAQAERQLEVFGKQQAADYELRAAVSSLCDAVKSQAEERTSKRQAAAVLGAQAKAEQAQRDAMKAFNRMVLLGRNSTAPGRALRGAAAHGAAKGSTSRSSSSLVAVRARRGGAGAGSGSDCSAEVRLAQDEKRRAQELLASTQEAARGLATAVAKTGDVEGQLKAMLQSQMNGAHLAEGRVTGEELKASMDQLFRLVQTQMASMQAPFEAVREKGQASSLADSRLVLELRSGFADAEEAVLAAKSCDGVL